MKYGAMNFPIKPLLREIEEIGEMGFDYVELTMDPPEATPQRIQPQKRSIKEILDRYRMGIMGHLPTFVWTADLYESLRKASLQEQFDALETAVELGVEKMVLHPGMITGLGKVLPDKVKRLALESIETMTLEVFSRDRDYLKISMEKIKRMWESL